MNAKWKDRQLIRASIAFGQFPGPDQLVPLAELCVFMVLRRFATPPSMQLRLIYYNTDCSCVKDCFEKGRATMSDCWLAHAKLWAEYFRVAAEHAINIIRVHWMKAHRTDDAAKD